MNSHNIMPGYLGLTAKERGDFSLPELISAAAVGDQSSLGFYNSCSNAVGNLLGQRTSTGNSFFLPADIMVRDLSAAVGGQGGYLVSNEISFASGLFGASLIGNLPMRPLPAQGNVGLGSISSITTQWLSTEATAASHADPTFGGGAATPKSITCSFYVSRHFTHGAGPGGMRFMQQQIGAKLGEAAGTALINGSGASGEPQGLLGISGTTGTSGTSLAWSGVRDLIAAAEGYSVGGLVFVMGVTAAKILRAREKASGNGMVFADGKIDGIPVIVSRSCPADALVLAPWPTMIMATWGALEVTVTPLADPSAFKAGRIGVRLAWSIDFLAEQPSAIGKATSIT